MKEILMAIGVGIVVFVVIGLTVWFYYSASDQAYQEGYQQGLIDCDHTIWDNEDYRYQSESIPKD